ncbi:MAG: XdhC family protein [Treponema sp.]|jgi:xanthine dehydrogenase accessory factor|nr:XdhC family protein [Treponema sp.]
MKYTTEKNCRYIAAHIDEFGIMERQVAYDGGVFTQKISRYPELVICGGGHVALALCTAVKKIGFAVTVMDDRKEFADRKRFAAADRVICGDFVAELENLERKNVWYAVMTRGHASDELCAATILSRPFLYLGMMGSKTKIEYTRRNLLARGIPQDRINSIHAPIGLAIGAQTPEEIAVSITAELIQIRAALGCSYIDEQVLSALRELKEPMVIATIIEKKGSAPRDVGSCMALSSDGTLIGTIGGGSVEAAARADAERMTETTAPFVKFYDLSNSAAADLGMVCGGSVKVLFEYVV